MTRPVPFEGSVLAHGLVVEASFAGEALAARVVAELAAGGRAFRLGDDVLVLFHEPRRLRTERVSGTPVVAHGRSYCTFDGGAELASRSTEPTLHRLSRGEVVSSKISALEPLLPSSLVTAGPLRVRRVVSLGEPPRPPKLAVDVPARPVRELVGIAPSKERDDMLASLREGEKPSALARVSRFVLAGLGALLARLRGFFSLRRIPARPVHGAPAKRGPAKPSLFEAMLARLSQVLVRLERLTGRQARYFADLLERLERGDLDEALRRAIPLGGGSNEAPRRLKLGVPSPRADLTIVPDREGASSTIPVDDGLQGLLRSQYEKAFQSLERQGRVREAAFVLAELLQQHARAVDFLEKHGELRLAAEIAEARGMPAERIVALWFLAGDRERAIALARRNGAFLAAITRLERSNRPEAAMLRLEYGDLLARAGRFLEAVDVVWPVPEGRNLARAWLERALEGDGLGSARAWARALALGVPTLADVKSRLLARLGDRSHEAALYRRQLGVAALDEAMSPLAFHVLERAYRGLLEDRHEHGLDVDRLVRKLEEKIGDAVLVADAPILSPRPPLSPFEGVLELGPMDVGTQPVHDAVALPDGRVLVALGEHGMRLLDRHGRTQLVFAEPAHALIPDDRSERFLAIAYRAETWRFARVDLPSRRVARWIEIPCSTSASSFDGETFFVATVDGATSTLRCLDALADEPVVLWSVSGIDGFVQGIHREPNRLRVVAQSLATSAYEVYTFELPSRMLRSRAPGTPDEVVGWLRAVSLSSEGMGGFATLRLDEVSKRWVELELEPANLELVVALDGPSADERRRIVARTQGATTARARIHGDFVTLADDQGRVVVLDRATLAPLSTFFV